MAALDSLREQAAILRSVGAEIKKIAPQQGRGLSKELSLASEVAVELAKYLDAAIKVARRNEEHLARRKSRAAGAGH